MSCPKCNGYIDGDRCVNCGKRIYEFIYRERKINKPYHRKKQRTTGIEGECRCCEHIKMIWSDGLCAACLSQVNGRYGQYYPVGSDEREEVLSRVREEKLRIKNKRKEEMEDVD